jgi:hypothetical protein
MQPPVGRRDESKRARGRIARSSVATHRALFAVEGEKRCDLCDSILRAEDDAGGSGLYVWTRGDEVRFEEPPLCARCGHDVVLVATRQWAEEEEEEG